MTSSIRASMGEGVFARALSAVGNTAREIGSAIARLGGESKAARELRATEMAQLAHNAHESLTGFLLRSTVAAGIKDGQVVYSVFGRGRNLTNKAIEALRAQGLHVLDAPKVLSELTHAERQLYAIGIREIGISRKLGMCDPCKNFFNQLRDVTVRAFGG